MNATSAATSVQLARADVIRKALIRNGWTVGREAADAHPGAVAATTYTRLGVTVLVLTMGGRRGQMIEITAQATTGMRGDGAHRMRDTRRSWRMTAYDPPPTAVLAAAMAACDRPPEVAPLELAGWSIEHAPARNVGANAPRLVHSTRFTRPDGAVVAVFHTPTFTPPCERCTHYGDLGDTGGWLITGPGFTAEATAHIPSAVIGEFTRALPGSILTRSAVTTSKSPAETSCSSTSAPAAVTAPSRTRAVG